MLSQSWGLHDVGRGGMNPQLRPEAQVRGLSHPPWEEHWPVLEITSVFPKALGLGLVYTPSSLPQRQPPLFLPGIPGQPKACSGLPFGLCSPKKPLLAGQSSVHLLPLHMAFRRLIWFLSTWWPWWLDLEGTAHCWLFPVSPTCGLRAGGFLYLNQRNGRIPSLPCPRKQYHPLRVE